MLSPEYGLSVLVLITIALFAILALFFVLVGRFYNWFVNLPTDTIDSILEEEKSDAPSKAEWGRLVIVIVAFAALLGAIVILVITR